MSQAQATALRMVPHLAAFHYRSVEKDSKAGQDLLAKVAAGVLKAEDVGTETIEKDGKEVELLKRASVKVPMSVPDVTSFVKEGVLSAEEQAYLQALIAYRMEQKQKPLVDAYKSDVITFAGEFGQPFTLKVSAVKVSADENKAAVEVLRALLAELVPEKAVTNICLLAEKRFSAAACSGIKDVAVLERVNNSVVEAFGALEAADEELTKQHTAAFTAWTDALEALITPKEVMTLDMFA